METGVHGVVMALVLSLVDLALREDLVYVMPHVLQLVVDPVTVQVMKNAHAILKHAQTLVYHAAAKVTTWTVECCP